MQSNQDSEQDEQEQMNNKRFYDLYMNFDSLRDNKIFPCDIDMIYQCADGYLIIGEAKTAGSHIVGKQGEVLTSIVDNHKYGGVVMEIEHTERVQDGATSVDIGQCIVRRAYFGSEWHDYKVRELSVLHWMRELKEAHGERRSSCG